MRALETRDARARWHDDCTLLEGRVDHSARQMVSSLRVDDRDGILREKCKPELQPSSTEGLQHRGSTTDQRSVLPPQSTPFHDKLPRLRCS